MSALNTNSHHTPILGITLGDTNGIGPEILVKALARPALRRHIRLVVFGDAALLEAVSVQMPNRPRWQAITAWEQLTETENHIPVFNAGCAAPPYRPGTLDARAGHCAAAWLEAAVKACLAGRLQGIVTCPVNKEGMLLSGSPYAGHTPMLVALSGVDACHMSLFSERMRIVHITAHLAMRDAVAAVKKERIMQAIEAGVDVMKRLGFTHPRLAVAGLNPHAGENGAFGDEERHEIAPAVEAARQAGISCAGPLPPDTVFDRMNRGEFDLVVAMYHDQGHIPFKLVAMDEGVHATLGLPFIRTSPDHGTAYDIAGRGTARANSLCAAIALAAHWVRHETPAHQEPSS